VVSHELREDMNRSFLRPRRSLAVLLSTSLLSIAITGCGGGGDGGNGDTGTPSAPTAVTFPVAASYSTYLTTARSDSFTSSGTIRAASYTATGTRTQTAAVDSTFEGKAVQTNTRTYVITANALGRTKTITATGQQYLANGVLAGVSMKGSYAVVTAVSPLPASAAIGASGTLYTATVYTSSGKQTTRGTASMTYSLEADSVPNSAILRLALTGTSMPLWVDTKIRISSTGAVSTVTETPLISNSPASLVYQQ